MVREERREGAEHVGDAAPDAHPHLAPAEESLGRAGVDVGARPALATAVEELAVAAAAMAGVPLTNGFISKEMAFFYF